MLKDGLYKKVPVLHVVAGGHVIMNAAVICAKCSGNYRDETWPRHVGSIAISS